MGSPEPRAVLTQRMEDGVGDVGAAGHAQGLEAVAATADCDEALVCDLLLGGGGGGVFQRSVTLPQWI